MTLLRNYLDLCHYEHLGSFVSFGHTKACKLIEGIATSDYFCSRKQLTNFIINMMFVVSTITSDSSDKLIHGFQ